MEQLAHHRTDFHEIWYLRIFRKSVEKIQVLLKSNKNKRYFTWRLIYILSYIAHFFLEWEMFQKKSCRKNQNTYFLLSNFFFSENGAVYERMWKTLWSEQATDDCGAGALHAGYLRLQIHRLISCNTHCFSTTTKVARTRLSVTLYVHCVSCITCIMRA
jgi:hypothetical protein